MTYEEIDSRFSIHERSYFRIVNAEHAMVIQGYDLPPGAPKPIKWKVENSWGKKVGNKGVYSLYDEAFDHDVYEVVIPKTLLNAQELQVLAREPLILNPAQNPYSK